MRGWSCSTKEHVDTISPAVIKEYYAFVDGVTKMNSLLPPFPRNTRTNKWTVRVIFNLASFADVNSWLGYLEDAHYNYIQHLLMSRLTR